MLLHIPLNLPTEPVSGCFADSDQCILDSALKGRTLTGRYTEVILAEAYVSNSEQGIGDGNGTGNGL